MNMKGYGLLLLAVTFISNCKQEVTTEFVKEISCYSYFSTVDWEDLIDKYFRPNTADWDSTCNVRIITGFPNEICAKYWHLLQNARTDFHQKSLPLRAKANGSECQFAVEEVDESELEVAYSMAKVQGFLPPPLMQRVFKFTMHMNAFFMAALRD